MRGVLPSPDTARRRAAASPVGAAILALFLAAAGALATATSSWAEPPLTELDGEVTDLAGVLDDEGVAEVEESLDELADATSYQLFVVYVETFGGTDGRTWADTTASNAQLGTDDLLLAVATQDRLYDLSWDLNVDLSDAELDDVRDAAEDALRDDDWAGATVAAVDTLVALDGGAHDDEADGGTSLPGGSAALALGLLAVAGVAFWLWRRSRRRDRDLTERGAAAAAARTGAGGPDADPLANLTTEQLATRAGRALVAVDDAVKTSEQELGFAQAEFGLEATREFSAALEQARADVAEAFRLRQAVEDAPPADGGAHRAMLADVVRRCEAADAALDAQADAFDELRTLRSRAPQVLDEAAQRAGEIEAMVEVARSTLAGLGATYPASALASVSRNPELVTALVADARTAVESGRSALAQRKKAVAVADARAAQNALGQAAHLLDAVESAGADLAAAGTNLDRAVASITQDMADADRLAPGSPALVDVLVEARQAAARGREAREGGDPLAALSRLAAAEAALDAALSSYRQQAESDARARALARDVVGRAESHLGATQSFVTTRRGAVGADARTRLAEAGRLLGEARTLLPTDPQQALATAQQAEKLAQQASSMARSDTAAWDMRHGGTPGGISGAGRRSPDLGSMILGGILLDSAAGRSRHGSSRRGASRRGAPRVGGFGGGFGGGRAGRGGSFGGGRGGGGRGGRGGRF
ncbi:TPM domain-containing protein [Isoptericola jiangsuensis]|uniref:TPM domain-containing protein n=1 Tax=Isoptericola jiangsuensis TaxID=548579 RepID=UPI003AAFB224